MIIKIDSYQLNHVYNGFYRPATSIYETKQWHEKIPEGKVTFSVRVGKKRKMIKGRIILTHHEVCKNSSGYNHYIFQPNNPIRYLRLIGELPLAQKMKIR